MLKGKKKKAVDPTPFPVENPDLLLVLREMQEGKLPCCVIKIESQGVRAVRGKNERSPSLESFF